MVLLSNSRRGVFLSEGGVWREHNTRAFAETMQLWARTHLALSGYEVVLQKSIPAQIRQLILYYY